MSVNELVEMTITFLSPVTPNDLLRSSLPYTYMEVDVQSMDGNNHDVQLYTDISAEWVSGDHAADAQWSFGVINEDTQPNGHGSPSSATWPDHTSASAYGTRTSFPYATGKNGPFGWQPHHGEDQGWRPQPSQYHPTWTSHPASSTSAESSSVVPTPYSTSSSNASITSVSASSTVSYSNSTTTSTGSSTVSVAPSPTHSAGGIAYHQVYRQQQLNFSEINQQANWGYWYYATDNTQDLTYQSGEDTLVRGQFIESGYLADSQDANYRPINDAYPVFGFALDFGSVGSQSQNTLFQLSLHQDQCIQFEGANGNETVPCLWTSYFGNDLHAVEYFYNDYSSNGQSIATSFDNQVSSDSIAAGGQNYLDLTSLAVRQAFGSLEYTNTPTTPYVFLKEISSDGNIQTVDIIFPFHPIAIYANVDILKWILDPLFINQEAGHWPYQFSIHDIGSSFPNATGHDDGVDEMQPLEECGNMLIMTLAYAQRANDNAYLAQHYNILNQWTQFLIQEALIPANQISTDDFAGALAYVVLHSFSVTVLTSRTAIRPTSHSRVSSVSRLWRRLPTAQATQPTAPTTPTSRTATSSNGKASRSTTTPRHRTPP